MIKSSDLGTSSGLLNALKGDSVIFFNRRRFSWSIRDRKSENTCIYCSIFLKMTCKSTGLEYSPVSTLRTCVFYLLMGQEVQRFVSACARAELRCGKQIANEKDIDLPL